MKFYINTMILVGLLFFYSPVCNYGAEKPMPFQPGEKLVFALKWVSIPAGQAVLQVEPFTTINGIKAYHFVMTAKTNKFVDFFYKVRDRIDAYADFKMDHSVFFKKRQKEGSYKKKSTINFDWEKQQVTYSGAKKKRKPIPLMPGSFDPLSAFYFIRMMDLKGEKCIKRPVTDGKKNVVGVVNVISRQNLKVNGKNYDTFLVEPELKHIGGVFKKSREANLQLWITAGARHIPVKIKSKVVVGTFSGELVSAEGLVP